MGDVGDDFSDDDATTVHGCEEDGDDEILPLEIDNIEEDQAKLSANQVKHFFPLKKYLFMKSNDFKCSVR